jgi:hypothetical protein
MFKYKTRTSNIYLTKSIFLKRHLGNLISVTLKFKRNKLGPEKHDNPVIKLALLGIFLTSHFKLAFYTRIIFFDSVWKQVFCFVLIGCKICLFSKCNYTPHFKQSTMLDRYLQIMFTFIKWLHLPFRSYETCIENDIKCFKILFKSYSSCLKYRHK